jgi:hypothetical protein
LDQIFIINLAKGSARRSNERSQEEQEGTEKPAFPIKNCLICNRMRNKEGKQMKIVCAKKDAQFLIIASKYLQDTVFAKTNQYRTSSQLLKASMQYHENCMKNYRRKYLKNKKQKKTATSPCADIIPESQSNGLLEEFTSTPPPEKTDASDILRNAAFMLRNECQNFDFGLDGKVGDEQDLNDAELK